MNRRRFLQSSILGTAGISMLPYSIHKPAPSDRVRVAHIGLGGMGNNHLKWFASLPNVEIVALCDVDEEHLAKSLQNLKNIQPNAQAKTYNDFRRVLEIKDIDAITCATPDHWHAQIAMLAFEAGKDVYGEKPLAYSVREGQQMLKSMKRYQKIFQLGTQIHAGDNYHRVAELIQAGAIGKVHTVRLWKTGEPPILAANYQQPPAQLNWDMWLGPAPYTNYAPERCHFNYRYFLDYSGGIFQDFWCHIADIVWWAISPQKLKSINARGAKSDGIGDTPKWIEVDYEFRDLKLYWTSTPPTVPGAVKKGIGAYFEGDKGTLLCDYNTREIVINGVTMSDIPEIPITIKRSSGHQQNFIDAIKTRTQPESNLEYARQMTMPMHLGLISWRLGRKLMWNHRKEHFKNDAEANSLLYREPRNAWSLV